MALPADRRAARAAAPSPPTPRSLDLPPRRAFVLPILFTAGLLAVALSAPLRQNPRLLWSSLGPGLGLLDKLLQVPLLNLSIRWLDRVVRREPLRRFDPAALRPSLAPGGRHLAYIGVWALVFAGMSAAQGVGDRHRGQGIPFWKQACGQDRAGACEYLMQLHATYCRAGSGWSCNELGILQADEQQDRSAAAASIRQACELGFEPACANAAAVTGGGLWATGPPPLAELPIVLRGSKGPIADRSPKSLYARACDQGWPDTCGRVVDAGSQ